MRDTTHDRRLDGRLRSEADYRDAVARCPICSPVQPIRGAARERALDLLAMKLQLLDAVDVLERATVGSLMELPSTEDLARFEADRVGIGRML